MNRKSISQTKTNSWSIRQSVLSFKKDNEDIIFFASLVLAVGAYFPAESKIIKFSSTNKKPSSFSKKSEFSSTEFQNDFSIRIWTPIHSSGHNELSRFCNTRTHVRECHEAIRSRTVSILAGRGQGTGGILVAQNGLSLIVTAAHVLLDHSNKREQLDIFDADRRVYSPMLVCLGSKRGTPLEKDYAFLVAESPEHVDLPPPNHKSNSHSERVFVGEHAGTSPNVVPLLNFEKKGDLYIAIPDLWTGASGGVVYDTDGAVVGIVTAGSDKLNTTIITSFDQLATDSFSLDFLMELNCSKSNSNKWLSKSDKNAELRRIAALIKRAN